MAGFTRRTHVVRISDAKPGDPPSDTYLDVEVLDAIAFRNENGKEMILNLTKPVAYIVDDTGGDNGQTPSNATRRSHMKRIVGDDPTQKLDVEVIDCLSFRDENGKEWILDMQGSQKTFNTTDHTGDSKSTRRTHNEKISNDLTDPKPTSYLTVERCDTIAFRGINGGELVIKCPSSDDLNSSDPRASTRITSPEGYDPAKDDGPKPPANTDSNVYLSFVKDANGFMTGDAKIAQGPFWWIRKVNAGGGWAIITATSNGGPPGITVRTETGDNYPTGLILYDKTVVRHNTPQDTWYCWLPVQSVPQYQLPGSYPSGGWDGTQGPFCGMDQVAAVQVGSMSLLDALQGSYYNVGKNSSGYYVSTYAQGGTVAVGAGNPVPQVYPHFQSKTTQDYKNYVAGGGSFSFNSEAAAAQMAAILSEPWVAVFRSDGCTTYGTLSWSIASIPGPPNPDEYSRTMIIKLQGVPSTFLLDLFLSGDQKSSQVQVVGEWPGLQLPITSDANGAILSPNDKFIVDNKISGAFGTAKSGTYSCKVTLTTDPPNPPKTKSPLDIVATPPL